ncbi:MAG: STAS domain-containing protein [Planctomycetota bacterium]|jgi:anti-anti-sigma factor
MTRKRPLNFHVLEPRAGAVVFELEGRLRGDRQSYAFQDEVIDRLSAGSGRVVLDFAAVDAVDARGVAILAAVFAAANDAGGELVLASMPRPIGKLLDIFWFLKALPHVDTVEQGLVCCLAPSEPRQERVGIAARAVDPPPPALWAHG